MRVLAVMGVCVAAGCASRNVLGEWARPVPGTTIVNGLPREVEDKASGMRLILIGEGTFEQGLPDDEVSYHAGEFDDYGTPAHRVRITKSFYLGVYEVTQGEWVAVMGTNPSEFARGPRYPVDSVTWSEASEFCRRTGFRLPTEAEWEYACGLGRPTREMSGSALEAEAWCLTEEVMGDYGPKPVGSRRPNPCGVFDMLGNVFEWCQDWYEKYPCRGDARVDPVGPPSGESKVARGGSWARGESRCTCTFRIDYEPRRRMNHVGFRVARDP